MCKMEAGARELGEGEEATGASRHPVIPAPPPPNTGLCPWRGRGGAAVALCVWGMTCPWLDPWSAPLDC